jgi:hypothetical protein
MSGGKIIATALACEQGVLLTVFNTLKQWHRELLLRLWGCGVCR